MKIAVFHNLPSGGGKRALYEFSKELKKRGFILDAFVPSTANELFLPLDSVVHRKFIYPIKSLPPYLNKKGIRWCYYNNSLPLALAFTQKKIANDINNGNYQLAFVHHSIVTQSPFILKYLKIPSLYFIQEPLRYIHEHPLIEEPCDLTFKKTYFSNVRKFYSYTLFKSIDESNITHATRLLVNSYYSHESVMRAYGLNSFVSYLGVDRDIFKPDKEIEKEYVIVSVGRLLPQKGFRFIIKALGQLRNIKKPKLIIIGDTDNSNEKHILTTLAKENGVDLEIKIDISDRELTKYYTMAALVVYAPYIEPFGLVPLEAMACGTPVIGVHEGGVRETIIHGVTGFLVERDVNKFADAIGSLLKDQEKRAFMGRNAIEYIKEKWTWQTATDNLISHFNVLLNKYE